MKKFLILWRLAGSDEVFGWRQWTHLDESEEACERWLRARFDEMFLKARREYQLFEIPTFSDTKSIDAREAAQ